MANMFGGAPQVQQQASRPRTVRLPVQNDPAQIAAAARTPQAIAARSGGPSTILTDQVKQLTGSSGQKLGA
jgi:hypothetical protein